jgi:endonuclease/exonuclease/phosphatase (EEP) superfamily protein YafD
MKVLSWNILHPDYAVRHNTKQGKIENRQQKIVEFIKSENLDVLLLQEVSFDFIKEIKKFYPDCQVFMVQKNSKLVCCYTAIIILEKYNVINVDSIVAENNSTAVMVNVICDKKEVTFCSLHLKGSAEDDLSYVYGLNDLGVILSKLNSISGVSQIIGGDFNKNLLSDRSLRLPKILSGGYLYDNLSITEIQSSKSLDAIFYKNITSKSSIVLDKVILSDHLPIVSVFDL